eukprot:TRINITY_DN4702_c5_g1_i1.p1 TRINITY_DN4702_c5_g1~~TRINITY_DN4702_c5_g1_i1.p1  ORF type:complete len:731 (+),score=162.68 TRINITY_DN4702_c5_g1_i1:52-2193(+)
MARVALVNLRLEDDLSKVATAAKETTKRLYVGMPLVSNEGQDSLQRRLGAIYYEVFSIAPKLDTRVLLNGFPANCNHIPETSTLLGYAEEEPTATELGLQWKQLAAPSTVENKQVIDTTSPMKKYDHICMGGTFDRLHIGQKLLLSVAAYSLEKDGRLFCGIAGDALFKEKALRELIEPYGVREREVRSFLRSVRSDAKYETAELMDGYGPSIKDPSFTCITVSEETKSGGDACNAKRSELGMPPLDVVIVGLVSPAGAIKEELNKNSKLSSSGARQALTGGLLHGDYLLCKKTPSKPYVIGLTGGIGCGKTTATKYLESVGTEIIYADKVGHNAYAPGTEGMKLVLAEYGDSIMGDNGEIDRRKLGALFFSSESEKDRLNNIVWPIIAKDLRQMISDSKSNVLVLEAAVLIEAGFDELVDEVWCIVAPTPVARTRLIEREKREKGVDLSEEDANNRINAQLPGMEKIKKSHAVLSNHSTPEEFTNVIKQCWEGLLERVDKKLADLDGVAKRWSDLTNGNATWWRTLRDHYHKPSIRSYHNLSHLEDMFELFDEYKSDISRPDLVSYAIFFHDVIYDPTRTDNEKLSAEMWKQFASSNNIAAGDIETVYEWIMATAAHMKHSKDATGDLAIFLDIDLGVLGRTTPEYFVYSEQISREYQHVPIPKFIEGRSAAMETFLQVPEGPYCTPKMQQKYGKQAVANVKAEIDYLKNRF